MAKLIGAPFPLLVSALFSPSSEEEVEVEESCRLSALVVGMEEI
jgi:hypothetical protein